MGLVVILEKDGGEVTLSVHFMLESYCPFVYFLDEVEMISVLMVP